VRPGDGGAGDLIDHISLSRLAPGQLFDSRNHMKAAPPERRKEYFPAPR